MRWISRAVARVGPIRRRCLAACHPLEDESRAPRTRPACAPRRRPPMHQPAAQPLILLTGATRWGRRQLRRAGPRSSTELRRGSARCRSPADDLSRGPWVATRRARAARSWPRTRQMPAPNADEAASARCNFKRHDCWTCSRRTASRSNGAKLQRTVWLSDGLGLARYPSQR